MANSESPFTDGARGRAHLGVYPIPDTTPSGSVHPRSTPVGSVVRIRLSSTIGVAPLLVSYSASMPQAILRGASVLWTDNGEPISNGLNGQRVFGDPGEHRVGVMVTSLERPRDRRRN